MDKTLANGFPLSAPPPSLSNREENSFGFMRWKGSKLVRSDM
jgi:hypothetical protein